MTTTVAVDPDVLERFAGSVLDACRELAWLGHRLDDALAGVDGRDARAWVGPSWPAPGADLPGVDAEVDALARLGDFAAWVARRARELDADGAGGPRRLPVAALGPAGSAAPWSPALRQARGAAIGARLAGRLGGRLEARDLVALAVLGTDESFATAVVAAAGGVPGLVAAVRQLDPGVPTTATHGDGRTAAQRQYSEVLAGLGTVLAAHLRDAPEAVTDVLVPMLRRGPGDDGFRAGEGAHLAMLVEQARGLPSGALARLAEAAIEVERTEGGTDAWARRASAAGGSAPVPATPDGQPVDVLASLLGVLARPGHGSAALSVLAGGERVALTRPDGTTVTVGARVSGLLDRFDHRPEVPWSAIDRAVRAERGRHAEGLAAATLAGESVALLADRIRAGGSVPAAARLPVARLLAGSMPAVNLAVNTRPAALAVEQGREWAYLDHPLHPAGLAAQPVFAGDDLARIIARLGASPALVRGLAASAVAGLDLDVARELASPTSTDRDLGAGVQRSARTVGFVANAGWLGVVADHRAVERSRDAAGAVAELVAAAPTVGRVAAPLAAAADADLLFFEEAVPADYTGAGPALREALEAHLLDRLLVRGWFDGHLDAIPPAVLRRRDGVPVGFDRTSPAFESWRWDPDGGYPHRLLADASAAFTATWSVTGEPGPLHGRVDVPAWTPPTPSSDLPAASNDGSPSVDDPDTPASTRASNRSAPPPAPPGR